MSDYTNMIRSARADIMRFNSIQGAQKLLDIRQQGLLMSVDPFEKLRYYKLLHFVNNQLGIDTTIVNQAMMEVIAVITDRKSANLRAVSDFLSRPSEFLNRKWDYCLIGGLGRSGTTALGQSINETIQHSVIFTERYSWDIGYCINSFEPYYIGIEDSFFEHQRSSNQRLLSLLQKRVNQNVFSIVGDKRSNSIYSLDTTNYFFTVAKRRLKYLHIVRNPINVANSWNDRANDVNDSWPTFKKQNICFRDFSVQTRLVINYLKNPLSNIDVFLIDYDKYFTSSDYMFLTLSKIFGSAHIDKSKCNEFIRKSEKYFSSPKKIDKSLFSDFEKNFDVNYYYSLIREFL